MQVLAAGTCKPVCGSILSSYMMLAARQLPLLLQDPVIFSGSVRTNLDPFGIAESDAKIWEALERAAIKPAIADLEVLVPHCSI